MPYLVERCEQNRLIAVLVMLCGGVLCFCASGSILLPAILRYSNMTPGSEPSFLSLAVFLLITFPIVFVFPWMAGFIVTYYPWHLFTTSTLHIISIYALYGSEVFEEPTWSLLIGFVHLPLIMAFNLIYSCVTARTPSEMELYRDYQKLIDPDSYHDVVESEKERILIDLA